MDRFDEMAELQRKWTPPAELAGSGTREVRLSGRGIAAAVLAGLLILGGPVASIFLERLSGRQTAEQNQLSDEGKDVEARVTRLWRSADKESRPMVTYQFFTEGSMYRKSVKAPLRIWKGLMEGSPLVVRYWPPNPTRSHPRDWVETPMPLWLSLLIGSLLAGLGVWLVFTLRRQWSLLREGRPAPAVVTRYSYAQHGQKAIHYEFPLMGGSLEKGRSGPMRKLPAIGATLCVLYDRDNPRRNALYPLEMARLADRGSQSKK
jgi:hypothetical protein